MQCNPHHRVQPQQEQQQQDEVASKRKKKKEKEKEKNRAMLSHYATIVRGWDNGRDITTNGTNLISFFVNCILL